jgi:hypothetical protein
VIAEFEGRRLKKTVFRHPFERDSIGILGNT